MATTRFIPPRFQEKYVYPYQKRLIKEIREAGGVTMLFTDEKQIDRLVRENESQPDVLAIGTGIHIGETKQRLGDKVCLFGNVDPVRVLLEAPRSEVIVAVKHCIDHGAPGGGFILATGECTCRDMPESNMYAMVEAAKKYGKYQP